ncbi:dihydroorotase [Oceanobacillus iheyensis]|uniref:dihydroorotase n=1 Tax=Oceanobacillus iheyensis TaxID=182710 RepID=UPI003643875A
MKTILLNANRLLPSNELEKVEVLIEDNKIIKIASQIPDKVENYIDIEGKLLLPGLIDVHIHLREPGGEHKETIKTGTMAAARGGYTTVCAMPNTNPVPDHPEALTSLLSKIADDAHIRVLPYASITKSLKGEERTDIQSLIDAGAFAFTDDGVGIQTADQMYQAMKDAARHNTTIVAHCEDNSLVYGGVLHEGEVSERLSLPGIPSLSESVQIARDILLAEATGCHYHVCHVSTKESVRVIRDAKKAGIHVTAEVSPHHLLLNETDIPDDNADWKMNPPLRSTEDQQALFDGLMDGTIDLIATDHAPHAKEEKAVGFKEAPFGIVGLETAFPLLYTHLVLKGKMTLYQLVERMTEKPAATFQLPYGKLEEDSVADITVIDLEKEETIHRETFYSKGKNTPFDNWKVKGIPVLTMVNGVVVYEEAKQHEEA